MDEQTNETTEMPKRRGRPRKNVILYRAAGGRIKAWNPDFGCNVNMPRLTEAAKVYDGMSCDWAAWGKPSTRDGYYNAANRNPFRQPNGKPDADAAKTLADDFADCKQMAIVLTVLAELFEGRAPSRPTIFHGSFWMRFFAGVFIREAGEDGISRSHFGKPEGKIWASVNVLPSQGGGYNYTEESWFAVVNMVRPPVFCVRIAGDEYLTRDEAEIGGRWTPERLAEAVLHSLWAAKGVDSCSADVPAAKTEPERAVLASEDVPPRPSEATDTPPVSSDPDAVSADSPETPDAEAEKPARAGKTWGEIKHTEVWLKGLTGSKELQAPAPLAKVLETVVSHSATANLTAECRAIADKKLRNEFKRDNLHVWYPSPVFGERIAGSNKGNIVGYTGLACLDFDNMPSREAAEDARDDIFMQFPEVLFCAVSAGGLGVYALVALDFDGTEDGYRASLSAAFEMFEAKGYMPDTGCIDPTRARYLSADADALSRPDAYVPKSVSAEGAGYFILPASMLRTCWTNSGRKRKGAGKAYLDEALGRIANAAEGTKDTTITSVMGTVARLIRNYGLDAEKTYDHVRRVAAEAGYDTQKTEDKIRRLGVANEKGSAE